MPFFPRAKTTATAAEPRHRADRAVAAAPLRRLSKLSLMFVGAIIVGLIGTGGSYAFLTSTASAAPSATLTAGTATLAVTASENVSLTNIYPGQTLRGQFTVSNTGDTSLVLSVTSITGTTTANGLVAGLDAGACSAASTQTTTGNIGATLAKGTSTLVCLTVSMPTNAPASAIGVTSSIVANITGTMP